MVVIRVRAMVATDPAGIAIGEVFLFPNGDSGFHLIDDESACVEGGVSMGGGDADDDGEAADLDGPCAVTADGVEDVETFQGFGEDAVSFFLREGGISLVFEFQHLSSLVMVAHPAFKRAEAAGFRIGDGAVQDGGVDAVGGEAEHGEVGSDSNHPPPAG